MRKGKGNMETPPTTRSATTPTARASEGKRAGLLGSRSRGGKLHRWDPGLRQEGAALLLLGPLTGYNKAVLGKQMRKGNMNKLSMAQITLPGRARKWEEAGSSFAILELFLQCSCPLHHKADGRVALGLTDTS